MIDERGSMAGRRLAKKKRRNSKKNLLHCQFVQPTEQWTGGPVAVSAKDLSDQDILHSTSQQFSVDCKYHKERWSNYANFRTFSVGTAQAIVSKVITPCRFYSSFIRTLQRNLLHLQRSILFNPVSLKKAARSAKTSEQTLKNNRPRTSLLDIYHPDPRHAPVAATTVFSTHDDGRRKHPKHVE